MVLKPHAIIVAVADHEHSAEVIWLERAGCRGTRIGQGARHSFGDWYLRRATLSRNTRSLHEVAGVLGFELTELLRLKKAESFDA